MKNRFAYRKLPKNKDLRSLSKKLRQAGNLPEVIFWQNFKNKEHLGFDLHRQYIIGNYIVDFFIPDLGLVFEIDGQSHDIKGILDQERDKYLTALGLQVIHFTVKQILYQINEIKLIVLDIIKQRELELLTDIESAPHSVMLCLPPRSSEE
jgi:very-short-patch-repair endonuclease